MLVQLSITNFAIIDRLHLDLSDGFNALTGETGAGKSIIIDAMSAMLGARIGPEFVRHGTQTARVEGLFDLARLDAISSASLRAKLLDAGLIAEDDPEHEADATLTLSREIHSSGRTVARVNGTLVNLATLQAIGEMLIDIHGQTEHQSLLRVPTHLDLLDQYAGVSRERERLFELVTRLRAVRKEKDSLQRDERELARRADLLQFQVDEIEKAALEPGEDEVLAQERTRLINSERLGALAEAIYGLLIEGAGDDEFGGGRAAAGGRGGRGMPLPVGKPVRDALGEAAALLQDLVRLDPLLKEEEDTLAGLQDVVEELGRKVRQYRETVEHDPERLMEVEERISLIHDLKRKYGATIEDVVEFGRQAANELETITHSEERIAELQAEEEDLLVRAGSLAEQISRRRREAGERLADAVEQSMRELLMGSIKFATSVTRTPDANGLPAPDDSGDERRWAFDTRGIDRVEFLISPNPGEPLKPLSKIASGGETSRLMLAMKSILSGADHTPTLIFDEVDVGVGGRSGQVVGEKLWSLTDNHQVICISHLPQIAAFADSHYKITKLVKDGRTSTRVDRLSQTEQVAEVAAMLGGTPVTSSSLENAREIIQHAEQMKALARGATASEAMKVGR